MGKAACDVHDVSTYFTYCGSVALRSVKHRIFIYRTDLKKINPNPIHGCFISYFEVPRVDMLLVLLFTSQFNVSSEHTKYYYYIYTE